MCGFFCGWRDKSSTTACGQPEEWFAFLFERLSITIAWDQPEEWLVFWLERLIVDFYSLGQPEECFVLWLERLSITAV
jgi:hypothetical protein